MSDSSLNMKVLDQNSLGKHEDFGKLQLIDVAGDPLHRDVLATYPRAVCEAYDTLTQFVRPLVESQQRPEGEVVIDRGSNSDTHLAWE